MMDNPVNHKIDNSIAAIWSMMLPGLGQLLKGQVMPGIIWAFAVGFGYFAYFWPGLILHAGCILDAAFHKGIDSAENESSMARKIILLAIVLALLVYIVLRNF